MKPSHSMERRRKQRAKLVTSCSVHFTYKEKPCTALMVDVTDLGAGFTSRKHKGDFLMAPGQTIIYTIKTPYGDSECSGRIVWSRLIEDDYSWGIEFTKLSSDAEDPLRCLMDSPF
jgi:hypothetical protein